MELVRHSMKAPLILALLGSTACSRGYDALTVDLVATKTIDCPGGETYSVPGGSSNSFALDCLGFADDHDCPAIDRTETACSQTNVASSCVAHFFAGCFEPGGTCADGGGSGGVTWTNGTEISNDLIRTSAGATPCMGIYTGYQIVTFIRPH
jgi:hypothetical protein